MILLTPGKRTKVFLAVTLAALNSELPKANAKYYGRNSYEQKPEMPFPIGSTSVLCDGAATLSEDIVTVTFSKDSSAGGHAYKCLAGDWYVSSKAHVLAKADIDVSQAKTALSKDRAKTNLERLKTELSDKKESTAIQAFWKSDGAWFQLCTPMLRAWMIELPDTIASRIADTYGFADDKEGKAARAATVASLKAQGCVNLTKICDEAAEVTALTKEQIPDVLASHILFNAIRDTSTVDMLASDWIAGLTEDHARIAVKIGELGDFWLNAYNVAYSAGDAVSRLSGVIMTDEEKGTISQLLRDHFTGERSVTTTPVGSLLFAGAPTKLSPLEGTIGSERVASESLSFNGTTERFSVLAKAVQSAIARAVKLLYGGAAVQLLRWAGVTGVHANVTYVSP